MQNQRKMKAYLDTTRKAKTPGLKEGDFVRVRKPVHVRKGKSKFSNPMQIVRKKGKHSFELSDGRTWDMSHLAPFHPEVTQVPEHSEQSTSTASPGRGTNQLEGRC